MTFGSIACWRMLSMIMQRMTRSQKLPHKWERSKQRSSREWGRRYQILSPIIAELLKMRNDNLPQMLCTFSLPLAESLRWWSSHFQKMRESKEGTCVWVCWRNLSTCKKNTLTTSTTHHRKLIKNFFGAKYVGWVYCCSSTLVLVLVLDSVLEPFSWRYQRLT